MSPLTFSKVEPSLLLESIWDFLSKIENMETAESFALAESEAIAFVRDTPIMAKTKAK